VSSRGPVGTDAPRAIGEQRDHLAPGVAVHEDAVDEHDRWARAPLAVAKLAEREADPPLDAEAVARGHSRIIAYRVGTSRFE
jgi:hypothetical protein